MTRKRLVAGGGIVALGVAAFIAWWFLSPLFIDKTVEEEFPFAAQAIVPENMSRQNVEATMVAVAGEDSSPVAEAMPDGIMDTTTGELSEGVARLKTGSFRDADSFHKGSGTATVYRGPDGSLVLRLENLQVTNGPDLHVLVSFHPNPRNRGEVMDDGYHDLGELKGNIGNQNYDIPPGVDPDAIASVVIYCQPFHVIFSVAPLE